MLKPTDEQQEAWNVCNTRNAINLDLETF
jgi:hypothetical protein